MAAKYRVLADRLREELGRSSGKQGYKLPTELELTARYQLSRQTVRHALRLLEEEGLIHRRQGSGSYATGLTPSAAPRQIAVVASFMDDYIFPAILHEATEVFSRQGYSTAVYATENRVSREREILLRLLEEPMSGLLVEGSKTALPTPNGDLYQRLRQAGTPMVFLHGAYGELSGVPCVADDNYGGGYYLGKYLTSLGHKKIAGIFKSDDIQGTERCFGLLCALRDENILSCEEHICYFDTAQLAALQTKQDTGFLSEFAAKQLKNTPAVVCYNDEIAYWLIKEFSYKNLRIPEDISIVCFDNSYLSELSSVRITSLSHKSHEMGTTAAEAILKLMKGSAVSPQKLTWHLAARQSCAPPPHDI